MASRTTSRGQDLTKQHKPSDVSLSEPNNSMNSGRGNGRYSLRNVSQKSYCASNSNKASFNSIQPTNPVFVKPRRRISRKKHILHNTELIDDSKMNFKNEESTINLAISYKKPKANRGVKLDSNMSGEDLQMTTIHHVETSTQLPASRTRRKASSNTPSIVEHKPKTTKGLKRKSDISVEALYLQEGSHCKGIVSTSLETVHEDRNTTGHKRRRITVFGNLYTSSKQKLKFRKDRTRALRKQGVKVPTGKMFTDQDVMLALAHIDDDEIM